jgi:hypothetical protein
MHETSKKIRPSFRFAKHATFIRLFPSPLGKTLPLNYGGKWTCFSVGSTCANQHALPISQPNKEQLKNAPSIPMIAAVKLKAENRSAGTSHSMMHQLP